MRRKITDSVWFWAVMILIAVVLFIHSQANAQAPALYVCRDTSYEGGVRYQFRNIPQAWLEQGYWDVADDGEMDGNVFIADALTHYPDDASKIKVGEAVIGINDATYSQTIKGTADTAPCDLPPESTPAAPQCPAWSFDTSTGEIICLWSLPPASS